MRALIPVPEPPPDMEILTSGFLFIKASAVACPIGSTVVEPLTTIVSAARTDVPVRIIVQTSADANNFNIFFIF
jgi:hypothetical protein